MTLPDWIKGLPRVRRNSAPAIADDAGGKLRLDQLADSEHTSGAEFNAPLTDCSSTQCEQEQRYRMLLSKGARLHARLTERSDCCSLAVLDRSGMVISWYEGSFGAAHADDKVLHRHVSQFYVPGDIAAGVPGRSLRCAADCGVNTQHGWRRRPGGAIYWGTTVVETIVARDGGVLGFAHVTRRSQGPWEAIHVAATRPRRTRRIRAQMRWSVGGGMSSPSLAAT